jgi:hypothetical protein
MKFRDPDIVPVLASWILQTLKLPKRHSADMKQYRKTTALANIADACFRSIGVIEEPRSVRPAPRY